jgi:hypothetical protein
MVHGRRSTVKTPWIERTSYRQDIQSTVGSTDQSERKFRIAWSQNIQVLNDAAMNKNMSFMGNGLFLYPTAYWRGQRTVSLLVCRPSTADYLYTIM